MDFSKSARYLNLFKSTVRVTRSRTGEVNRRYECESLAEETAASNKHYYSNQVFFFSHTVFSHYFTAFVRLCVCYFVLGQTT